MSDVTFPDLSFLSHRISVSFHLVLFEKPSTYLFPPSHSKPTMDSDPGPSGIQPRRDPSTSSTPSTPTDPFSDSRSPPTNPFASPDASRPASSFNSLAPRPERAQRYFHSRRIRKGEVEKPWLEKKDPREKWVTILPILGIVLGLGIAGFLVWDGVRSVVRHKYCEVLIEDFSKGLRDSVWMKEVELGGFG